MIRLMRFQIWYAVIIKDTGILFMDEFDKKMYPSFSGNGQNVNFAIQAQLLTLIEGKIVDYKYKESIDTSKTLFIGMGAFDMVREKKKNPEKHVGFGAVNSAGEDHYCDITREDMLELGGACELLGRFSTVINYHRLSEDTVDKLIDRFVRDEINNTGWRIELTENMRQDLHNASNGKYGCRALKSIIHNAALTGALLACDDDIELDRCCIRIDSPDDIEYRLLDSEDFMSIPEAQEPL